MGDIALHEDGVPCSEIEKFSGRLKVRKWHTLQKIFAKDCGQYPFSSLRPCFAPSRIFTLKYYQDRAAPKYRICEEYDKLSRKRVEEIFGWMKTVGGFRKARFRGLARFSEQGLMTAAAYNMMRLSRLVA